MDAPPFFVVGCGRSGTTLLRLMLDEHSQLAVPNESHFIDRLVRRWPSCLLANGALDPHAVVAPIEQRLRSMGIDPARAGARLGALQDPTPARAVDAIFRVYADAGEKARWGDKTPGYAMAIPLLDGLFPGMQVVHVVRDGRNVALSYFDQEFGPSDAWEAAIHWQKRVRTARRDGRSLGPERYCEVRYEDLVAAPRELLEGLCGFLGVGFEEPMLAFHFESERKLSERKPQWRGLYQPVSSGMRDWRSKMPERDVRRFESIAGETLGAFGYERRFPDSGAGSSAAAFLARRRHELRAAVSRGRAATRRRGNTKRGALPPPSSE